MRFIKVRKTNQIERLVYAGNSISVLIFLFLFATYSLLVCFPLSAQGETRQREDIWLSLNGEMALYSPVSLSYGGGISAAYGDRVSIGMRASWFFDGSGLLNVMELSILLRFFIFESPDNSGLFIQLAGGPAVYFDTAEAVSLPTKIGMASIGLAAGWRFLFGKYFFVEPSIRGGYPYLFGVGVSAGARF